MSDWRASRPAWLEGLLASLPVRLGRVRLGRASLRGRALVVPVVRAEVEVLLGPRRVALAAHGELVLDRGGVRGEIVAEEGPFRVVIAPRVTVRGGLAGTTVDATGVVSGQPLSLHAQLEGTTRRPRYRGVLRVEGSALPLSGALTGTEPRVVLALDGRPVWLSRVLARAGVSASFDDATLGGRIAVDARGSVRGEVTLEARVAELSREGGRVSVRAFESRVEISGAVHAPQLSIHARAGSLRTDSFVLSAVSTHLAVKAGDAPSVVVRESEAEAYGGRLRAVGPVESLQVELDGVSLAVLDALAEASGGPPPPHLPIDVRATGVLARSVDGTVGGHLALDVGASRLALDLTLDARGALRGSRLQGTLSLADVAKDAARGSLAVDARLEGTTLAPSAHVRLSSPRITVLGAVPVFLEDVAVEGELSPERIAWRGLVARLYGGRLDSDGSFGVADGTLHARVRLRDVRVERLGRDVQKDIEGALGLEGTLERAAKGAVVARGQAKLSDAEYHLLRASRDELARFGLPPLPTRSAGPAQARLRYEGGVLIVDELLARVPGVDLSGALRVDAHGGLRGAFDAHLLDEYLKRSALLSVPAVLAGRITVPIVVKGTVHAPRVEADLVRALGVLLANNRLRDAVSSLLGPMGAKRRR